MIDILNNVMLGCVACVCICLTVGFIALTIALLKAVFEDYNEL